MKMGHKGDDLGDRMKMYEMREAGRRCLPLTPILVRLDGKNFSRFTKSLARPFDEGFVRLMWSVTEQLVAETGAKMGYTQSDEISLVLYSDDMRSQVFFDGRIQKLCSVLASAATAFFNGSDRDTLLPSKIGTGPALFDCRVWTVPNKTEAANAILWRERDAYKNAIQSAARSVYSHKECHDKDTGEMIQMLSAKGIEFETHYPAYCQRGTFFQRKTVTRKYTTEEIDRLPLKHDARTNPDLEIRRNEVKRCAMPPFDQVINRVEVIFDGAQFLVHPNYAHELHLKSLASRGVDLGTLPQFNNCDNIPLYPFGVPFMGESKEK